MHRAALSGLLLAGVVTAAWPAEEPPTAAASCAVPASGDPLLNRAGLLAAYERLPQPCLRQLFVQCNEASARTLLDFGSAAMCSLSYEALLHQGFDGDFGQLMAWWRSQRGLGQD